MKREHIEKEFYLYLLEALNKYSCVCKKKKKKKKILKVNVYTCKEINLIEELPTNYRTIHTIKDFIFYQRSHFENGVFIYPKNREQPPRNWKELNIILCGIVYQCSSSLSGLRST